MKGRLIDLSMSLSGRQRITLELDDDFRDTYQSLRDGDVRVDIKRYVKPRSMDANKYAWVLIGKLAAALRTDQESLYEILLRRYGTTDTYLDDAGNELAVLFTLAPGVPPGRVARHYEKIGTGYAGGRQFIHYRAIRGTSEYDTKEMSVFLDGVISECRELDIETDTPEQIARYKELWNK